MELEDLFQAAFVIIIILGSIFGTLIERFTKKKREAEVRRRIEERRQRGEEIEEPVVEDQEPLVPPAKLPYEDMAEQIFGDYIEKRKRDAEERIPPPVEDVVLVEEELPPYREPADMVIHEGDDDPMSPVHTHLEAVHSSFDGAKRRNRFDKARHAQNIENLVFKGRNLNPVAKGIVYAEIFGPPPSMRGRRR